MKQDELLITKDYVFFYNGYLSNWYPSYFNVNKIKYNCMEQFMMAEKARAFHDNKNLSKIMKATAPAIQKALGRNVENYNDNVWQKVRYNIVVKGTIEKYKQNPDLKEKLFTTKGLKLVEASPYDTIWGIGLGIDNPKINNTKSWNGQNLLGKAITEARDFLLALENK